VRCALCVVTVSEEEMESNERRVHEWLNGSNEDEDEEDPITAMDCHEGQSPISPGLSSPLPCS